MSRSGRALGLLRRVADHSGRGRVVRVLPWLLTACSMSSDMVARAPGPVCPGRPVPPGASSEPPADAVRWYGPEGRGDRATLDAWCDAVAGPATVAPAPSSTRTWTPGDTLTVIAWNVAIGGGDLFSFLATELGVECDVPGSPRAAQPFALLIQEASRRSPEVPDTFDPSAVPWVIEPEPRPGPDLDIVQVAERCGLWLAYVPSARNGDREVGGLGEDKGNAVLSNLALRDPLAVELPFEAGRKVAVGASADGPGGPIRLVSVHLDVASSLIRTLITGNGTRVRQAEGLAEALELDDPEIATVVGGDFNTWSETETALLRFYARYPESPPPSDTPTRGHFTTDHIFFGPGAEGRLQMVDGSYRRIEPRYYSDHQARAMRIVVEDARPGSGDPGGY